MSIVGCRIKQRRTELGLSPKELAHEMLWMGWENEPPKEIIDQEPDLTDYIIKLESGRCELDNKDYLSFSLVLDCSVLYLKGYIDTLREESFTYTEDTLEDEYQKWLKTHLDEILKRIENIYFNEYRTILSEDVFIFGFAFVAKRIDKYILYHHSTSEIVDLVLQESKNHELEKLKIEFTDESIRNILFKADTIYNSIAFAFDDAVNKELSEKLRYIDRKYRYFYDRCRANIEIGKKLRTLLEEPLHE